MELSVENSSLSIEDDSFAWRYMNYDKIVDLLTTDEIYFARLDTFEDPLEGLDFELCRDIHQKTSVLHHKDTLNPILPVGQMIEGARKKIISRRDINSRQHGAFASCWYLTERKEKSSYHYESMAMWSLYSNAGFAVKIKFDILKSMIESALTDFKDEEIVEAFYGKVVYQNFYDRGIDNSKQFLCTPLIKEKSFEHENELRFILFRNGRKLVVDRTGIRLKLKQSFKDLGYNLTIIANPNYDDETFDRYKNDFVKKGFQIHRSSIPTKKSLKGIINEI